MKLSEAIERLRAQAALQHLAWNTEQSYVGWLRRYFDFLRAHRELDAAAPAVRMEAFLTDLAQVGKVSASTQNQAFNAVLYFYRQVLRIEVGKVDALRAKRPARERIAPHVSEVLAVRSHIVDTVHAPGRLLFDLLYGCGLRVTEPLNLRIRDVDMSAGKLLLRAAKGNKDRWARIPGACMEPLRAQLAKARAAWEWDRAHTPLVGVPLPNALERKYPRAPFALSWFWVFPAPGHCHHPRTGRRVHWRLHEATLQRIVKEAAAKEGMEGVLTPHVLRHAYATHQLAAGTDIRTVAELLGHNSIETTAGYLHPQLDRAGSPLDRALSAA